ncbi:DUF4177 domain-containing protein [Planctomycetota bacterium]
MRSFDYKVVKLPMKGLGIFSKDVSPDLNNALNSEGQDGWQLVNSIMPTTSLGETDRLVLIFMRDKERNA